MADIRTTILNADDLDSEEIAVPEWGGVKLKIKAMSGRDRAALQRHFKAGEDLDMEKWYTEIALATVFDPETDRRVFDPADRKVLGEKSARVLERIVSIATRLSGMTPSAVAEAEGELKSE